MSIFRGNRDVFLCSRDNGEYVVETPFGSVLARFVSKSGAMRELGEHGYRRANSDSFEDHWYNAPN